MYFENNSPFLTFFALPFIFCAEKIKLAPCQIRLDLPYHYRQQRRCRGHSPLYKHHRKCDSGDPSAERWKKRVSNGSCEFGREEAVVGGCWC